MLYVFRGTVHLTLNFVYALHRLHYSWIDIGTPSVSFLVALDAGSDLLWVPCNCIQCAPLSASHYSSLVCQSFVTQPSNFVTFVAVSVFQFSFFCVTIYIQGFNFVQGAPFIYLLLLDVSLLVEELVPVSTCFNLRENCCNYMPLYFGNCCKAIV